MPEENGSNKSLLTLIGVGAAIIGWFLANQFLVLTPSFDEVLMKTASELNKSLPMMVDSETQLDNTISLPDNTFQYNYTLINIDVDSIVAEELHEALEGRLANNIKNNPDMKAFRENEVTMCYSYSDKDGQFITKIIISPEDYQ